MISNVRHILLAFMAVLLIGVSPLVSAAPLAEGVVDTAVDTAVGFSYLSAAFNASKISNVTAMINAAEMMKTVNLASAENSIEKRDLYEYWFQACVCKHKLLPDNFCWFAYADSQWFVNPIMQVFDNNCNTIGWWNPTRSDHYSLGDIRGLPWTVEVRGAGDLFHSNTLYFMYAGAHHAIWDEWLAYEYGLHGMFSGIDDDGRAWLWQRIAWQCR